jgi:hypothetical protein
MGMPKKKLTLKMNGLAETGRPDARDSRNEMEKWRTQGERENGRSIPSESGHRQDVDGKSNNERRRNRVRMK